MGVRWKRLAVLGTTALLTAGLVPLGGIGAEAKPVEVSPASSGSATAAVDAVPTPKLDWFTCSDFGFQCTTVKVPRDYDRPNGAQVELALGKLPARQPKQRIGSLFVNPGGPGGSAVDLAAFSSLIFSPDILDRFDIVGMDPRGIGYSDNVQCLDSFRDQIEAYAGYTRPFPVGKAEEKAWLASDKKLGAACSDDALAKSMSTAEVARDMELMRRAVGDKKLTYLGFSYGSYLGQTYANLFPNRFRAVAVDGVIDPISWAGNASNQSDPLEFRLRSSVGAWKAMRELLKRCDKAGGQLCAFAPGDPVANFALIAERLKAKPIVEEDPFFGGTYTFGYSEFVTLMLVLLYDPAGYESIAPILADLIVVTEPPATGTASARRADARTSFRDHYRENRDKITRPGYDFPYENFLDAFASVTCTDSKETTKGSLFPAYAAQADERAPYFGRAWLWAESICAGDTFTGNDEDAYTGPFNVKTAAPVLFVGNYYDPATNYDNAKSASARMPNARLLSSDSWGHTAYGTSDCVTSRVDAYLLSAKLPAKGTVCKGDIQPFAAEPEELGVNATRQQALERIAKGGELAFR